MILFSIKKSGFPELKAFFSFIRVFIFLVFISTGAFQQAGAQPMAGENLLNSKEIRINKSDIQKLFNSKKGENISIQVLPGNEVFKLDLLILNHQNEGPKSGAIAARFILEKSEARLLANRKDREGKIVYWIAILPAAGDDAFKIKEETADSFILIKVAKGDIVSE
jgi:hypothetical protein